MRLTALIFSAVFTMSLSACEKFPVPAEQEEQKQTEDEGQQDENENTQFMTMNITAGGKAITATLADNMAAKALADKLQSGPVTVEMKANGFEHYGPLGFSLERQDEKISAVSGDIMLYNGDNICIFYGSNSWSYTPLGKVDGKSAEELKAFFGTGTVSVTFSTE